MTENKINNSEKKPNCWEYNCCGREPGGKNIGNDGVCPVSVDKLFDGINKGVCGGRICWEARKYHSNSCILFYEIGDCTKCEFYNIVHEELIKERNTRKNRFAEDSPRIFQYLSKLTGNLVSPISLMKLNLACILKKPGNQQISVNREMVNSMLELTTFMEDVLTDIQDISVLGSKDIDINPARVNYISFFQQILSGCQSSMEDKGIISNFIPSSDEIIMIDSEKMNRALKSLLDYFIKSVKAGASLEFRILRKDRFIMTHLISRTPIDKEKIHPGMFDDFYQYCSNFTGKEKNSRLLLAVVQEIIRAHGGIINSTNLENKGAMISFSLPSLS